LTVLINDLSATREPFVLILDDYQWITARPVHDAVVFLIEHSPRDVHTIVATRADPPLSIARLRGRGQLVELRQSDLRFTPEQAGVFLNQAMGLQAMGLELSAEERASLVSRTEGWIAGLQMAALAIRSLHAAPDRGRPAEDTARFVQAFTGSNRYILDYLLEEVLTRQPLDVQTFLQQTSILDRLNGPLCDAVCDLSDSRERLEALDRANLFIVPLDDRREWYRYHRLFADLLRRSLQRAQPDALPHLHSRASAWYEERASSRGGAEQRELLGPAVEHALAAGDVPRTARLIEQVAQEMLMRSEVVTLLRWIEALPRDQVRAAPALSLYHAWALLLAARPNEEIQARLRDLEGSGEGMRGHVATMRAFQAYALGEIPAAIELSRQARELLPADDPFLRSFGDWFLGLSRAADGDLDRGGQALEDVIRTSQGSGNLVVSVMALAERARMYVRQGRLHEAKTTFERALAAGTDGRGRPLPVTGRAMIALGALLREWNELEAAEETLVHGIQLTEGWRKIATLPGYLTLAPVRQARGDLEGARQALAMARQRAIEFDAADWDDRFVELVQARLDLAQGDVQAAARWAENRETRPGTENDFMGRHLRRYEHPVLARLSIAQGRPGEALALLEPLRSLLEPLGRVDLVIGIEVLRALALQAGGELEAALGALDHALSLGEPGGYVRVFLDEGEPVGRLLRRLAARGSHLAYIAQLLAALDAEVEPSAPGEQALVEPLSERELEVLRLLAAGLSNRAIGETLVIALGTVKKHLKNIYGKLDVHSRTQAVVRARELDLL
jgi:LuxR family maltose regulon positive regulatory protein